MHTLRKWRQIRLALLAAVPSAVGWEQSTAAGLDDHELARVNRQNELDPDLALWQLTRAPITDTRRP